MKTPNKQQISTQPNIPALAVANNDHAAAFLFLS